MRTGTENQVEGTGGIELFLIRHGETESNRTHRYLGRTEEPLSPTGRSTLEGIRKRGMFPAVDICFCSPMVRCRESAGILFPEQKPRVIEVWREIDFGDFEGKNYKELSGDPRYQEWIDSNGTMPFPHGESREHFVERCVRGYGRMAEILEGMPRVRRAAAVVHGGTIMAILSREYGGEYFDYQIGNGCGFRCRMERGRMIHIEEWK